MITKQGRVPVSSSIFLHDTLSVTELADNSTGTGGSVIAPMLMMAVKGVLINAATAWRQWVPKWATTRRHSRVRCPLLVWLPTVPSHGTMRHGFSPAPSSYLLCSQVGSLSLYNNIHTIICVWSVSKRTSWVWSKTTVCYYSIVFKTKDYLQLILCCFKVLIKNPN